MKAKFHVNLTDIINGTTIDPKGISLELYKRNPVITLNFDHAKVIGKTEEIKTTNDGLFVEADLPEGEAYFATSGLSEYAPGYIIKKFSIVDGVKVVEECELLEISKVR